MADIDVDALLKKARSRDARASNAVGGMQVDPAKKPKSAMCSTHLFVLRVNRVISLHV